jgi:hypothetical protein
VRDERGRRRGDEDDVRGARDEIVCTTRGGSGGRHVGPAMTRTMIDDSGGSNSDLGEGEDDCSGSGSRHHAWTGGARTGLPAETVREVRTCGGCARGDDDRAAAARWLLGEEDEMMQGEERRRYIGETFSPE